MRIAFLDPGLFRTELALEQVELQADSLGGYMETWREIGTVFALVEPLSARARFGAGQTLEDVTHRISMRGEPRLASGMRLRKADRTFEIATVHDPDGTGRYLSCLTREKGR